MVELRMNDLKLDVNFLLRYQLIQIERKFFVLSVDLFFFFLEALSTPSHLINPSILSTDKYAGMLTVSLFRFKLYSK